MTKKIPIIDQYLRRTIINLPQHQAGEMLLELYQQAQRSIADMSDGNSTKKTGGNPDDGELKYADMMAKVRARFGHFHAYVVDEVLTRGWDCRKNDYACDCLKESLGWIAEQRLGGGKDPLRNLLRAAERGRAGGVNSSSGNT